MHNFIRRIVRNGNVFAFVKYGSCRCNGMMIIMHTNFLSRGTLTMHCLSILLMVPILVHLSLEHCCHIINASC